MHRVALTPKGVRARAATFVLAVLLACGPVDDPPQSPAPINSCTDNPCGAYKQPTVTCTTGNFCQAQSALDPVLLVSIPASSQASPGQTFASTYKSLLALKLQLRGRCTSTLCLPLFGESTGSYQVKPSAANDVVHFYLGKDPFNFSIPVHVTVRPLWRFDTATSATGVDATMVGLPLLPRFAKVTFGEQAGAPGPGDPPTANIGYAAPLPAGAYERTMLPDPPFDRAFPPLIEPVAANAFNSGQARVFSNAILGTDLVPVDAHEVTVTRSGGNLAGWTMYLRDIVSGRRISTLLTLEASGGTVSLFTANQGGPANAEIRDGAELVVAPPELEAGNILLPEYTLAAVANSVPKKASYPALPPQVFVKGFVGDVNSARVGAQIIFQSTEILPRGDDSSKRDLHLSTKVVTDAQGNYSVSLPPGKYKAIITPAIDSGFAKTIADLSLTEGPQTQDGKKLTVSKPPLLKGVCKLTDGRPVADAEVEAHASSSLLVALPLTERDRARWPRTVITRTSVQGEFVLPVDPGTYDVVVRPAPGTRFPWLVRPQVVVASGSAPLDPLLLEVPVPRHLPITLNDYGDNPIVNGLVRVYVGHATSGGSVALEIARVRTGPGGEFDLYVDPQAK